MLRKTTLSAAALALGLAALPAQADVAIGIDTGSGFQQVAFDTDTTTQYNGVQDGFSFNAIVVSGPTPNPLDSTSFQISSIDGLPNSITVYVSANDATQSGALDLLSSLTANLLPASWTSTISTYVSNTNVLFATTTQLASNLFTTSPDTFVETDPFVADGSWSATGIYTLNADTVDSALLTLTIRESAAPVPEPASLGLLGASLFGMGALYRRRRLS